MGEGLNQTGLTWQELESGGPIPQCWAKLHRASIHFNDAVTAIKEHDHVANPIFAFPMQIDAEKSKLEMVVRKVREPPLEWSLQIGDFVQNARAALDYLIWQFIIHNGAKPTHSAKFPIFDEKPADSPENRETKRWRSSIRGLSDDALLIVEQAQPYHFLSGNHALAALRTLSNIDKHRFILPGAGAIAGDSDRIVLDINDRVDIGDVQPAQIKTGYRMADGDVILEADIDVIGPKPDLTVNGSIALDWAFGDELVPVAAFDQMAIAVAVILGRSEREVFGCERLAPVDLPADSWK